MKIIFILANCLLFRAELTGQSLLNVVENCRYVKGNVVSTTANITEHTTEGSLLEYQIVQTFDKKNRLISSNTYNSNKKEIEISRFYYSKGLLIKQSSTVFGNKKSLFYQYRKQIPRQILEVNADKKLLSISKIFLDSLSRPTLLHNYNLRESLQFSQLASYEDQNSSIIIEQKEAHKKAKASLVEYQLCSDDIYLETINPQQFENLNTKILNLNVEENIATIVKAVRFPQENKEEILIQELEFDKKGNWTSSKLFRLKKRKQKKILVQQIERTIEYR